ncbi:MAG: ribosome-associated translation inhibitor RaiA [Neomegalonema sp.]|nr:ribosome-associated translation inhibitor RaiA [Neomegalonema sp.]
MRIEVAGRHIDVGEALRTHISERLEEVVLKYAARATDARATVSRDGHMYVCDCTTHLSTGMKAQASGKADEVYAACDQAVARLEKQLRRYKRRLKDHHHHRSEPIPAFDASAYVLDAAYEEPQVDVESEATDNFWTPAVIAETTQPVARLTVGEAVMQMELAHANFLLFVNDGVGRLNAVYRREDGHIGWIDPVSSDTAS